MTATVSFNELPNDCGWLTAVPATEIGEVTCVKGDNGAVPFGMLPLLLDPDATDEAVWTFCMGKVVICGTDIATDAASG